MKKLVLSVAVVSLVGVTAGCVSRATHQQTTDALALCEQEKAEMEQQLSDARQKYDLELTQWRDAVGSQREATEATISEMESTLDRIKVALPEQVRGQVESNLDQVRRMMSDGLLQLADQNTVLAGKLEETRVQLETANTRLEGIDQRMATSEDLSTMAEERRTHIAGLVERFATLVDEIHEYDRTRLNCKECEEYLGLKKRKSGDLQTFHDDLVAEISRIQGELGQ